MNKAYHTDASHVNKTGVSCPAVTSQDLAMVSKTLRPILSTIMALTRKRGYCYASMTYIGNSNARSLSTARRHVRELIRAGIVRRQSVPGFEDLLFICPVDRWNLVLSCTESERTLIPISDPAQASPNHNKQPARKQAAAPADQPAARPVVCLSAKGFPEGEKTPAEPDELPEDVSALLAASIEAAEANAALGDGVTPEISCAPLATLRNEKQSVTGQNTAPTGQNAPESAPIGQKQADLPCAPLATSPDDAQPVTTSPKPQPQAAPEALTSEQQAILQALCCAGVGPGQAAIMARRDARKAQDCLKALAAYIARGEDVPSPGGLLWSLWSKPEFRFVERQRAKPAPVYVRDTEYRIVPTADSIVPPGMAVPDAAADATRRAVIAAARRSGGSCAPV